MKDPVYQDEYITLYHSDNLSILPHLEHQSFDCCFTDPPYGVGKEYSGKGEKSKDTKRPAGSLWALIHRLVTKDGSLHMTVSTKHLPEWLSFARIAGWHYLHTSAYVNKRLTRGGSARFGGKGHPFAYAWEPWLHFARSKEPVWSLSERMRTDVFEHSGVKATTHPAERDISAWREMLRLISPTRVLEPFSGAGTTAVVCKEMKIPCVAIEREEEWVEASIARFQQTTIFEQLEMAGPVEKHEQGTLDVV